MYSTTWKKLLDRPASCLWALWAIFWHSTLRENSALLNLLQIVSHLNMASDHQIECELVLYIAWIEIFKIFVKHENSNSLSVIIVALKKHTFFYGCKWQSEGHIYPALVMIVNILYLDPRKCILCFVCFCVSKCLQ